MPACVSPPFQVGCATRSALSGWNQAQRQLSEQEKKVVRAATAWHPPFYDLMAEGAPSTTEIRTEAELSQQPRRADLLRLASEQAEPGPCTRGGVTTCSARKHDQLSRVISMLLYSLQNATLCIDIHKRRGNRIRL
jgi:hypothetical protein